jgi:hypothetical protein
LEGFVHEERRIYFIAFTTTSTTSQLGHTFASLLYPI